MKNNHIAHLTAEHLQIGDRIKLRIQHLNCSQYDLARYCNVTLRTVYNWCENKSIPELKVIPALCFRLQSHISWLITGRVEQHQWVDEFPDGFFDFLNVIREVPAESRGDVLRSVFNMVVNLYTQVNSRNRQLINNFDSYTPLDASYFQVYKHEMQEKLTFSERLTLQKVQLNLSNNAIAMACDVSVKTVYNWSTGKYLPSLESLPTLCNVLRANLTWLVTGACDVPQWLNVEQVEFKNMLYQLNKLPVRITCQILRLTSIIVKEIQSATVR